VTVRAPVRNAPAIAVYNRQRRVRFDLNWLRKLADAAVGLAFKYAKPGRAPMLGKLSEVEVSIVSDSKIAAVHLEYMGIPGPTDVITFQHGEILISGETARANALRYRTSIERELALYTIHGLLHLNGFDDRTAGDAAEMHRLQARLLRESLALQSLPS
jgi:probable rRNA maturation factor